ncbi:MAG: 16S rRNA (cytidine(1402)-2'-O)-methyltransferase [Pseudomonadota bacterium]
MSGILYIVATPIGNLEDLSPRAVNVLKEVDLIAAEDTRRTAILLRAYEISTSMTAYHEHSDERCTRGLVDQLVAGDSIALVSDAGTPAISDPGYRLVRAVQRAGVQVVPLPGACAAIAALSCSGVASDHFFFEGFLPAKAGARRHRLEELSALGYTIVIYEAPHRLYDTLAAMLVVFGAGREVALARELTKTFETVKRAPLGELVSWVREDSNQERGEIVLIVGSEQDRAANSITPEIAELLTALAQSYPARKAAKLLSPVVDIRTSELYDFLLEQKRPKS